MTKLALVGCGYWGKNYIPTIGGIRNAKLTWICDSETAINKSSLPPGCRFTTKYSEVLDDKEVVAIIIATPPSTHFQLAKMALEKGKDVLVEKPMTTDSREAMKLNILARKSGRVLMIGHLFLFNTAVLKLKDITQNKRLGNIQYIYSRRSGPGPVSQDVNAIWSLAPHDISISNFLTGEIPVTVSANAPSFKNKKAIGTASMSLSYAKIKTFIYVSWLEPIKTREVTVVGDKKTAIFDDLAEKKLKIYDNADPAKISFPHYVGSSSPLKNQCLHFLKCLKTRQDPITNGQEGCLNVKILENIEKSLPKK